MRIEEKFNDAIWMTQFQSGDETALKDVYELYGNPLCQFATNLVSDEEEARDIVAESFVKLWGHNNNFKEIGNIKAFLYVITRNACLNHLRSSKKVQSVYKEFKYLAETKEESTLHKIIRKETLEHVYNKIEELPEMAKKIFKMVYLEGLGTEQVAQKLNMHPQRVRNNKSRAVAQLKIFLFQKNPLVYLMALLIFAN